MYRVIASIGIVCLLILRLLSTPSSLVVYELPNTPLVKEIAIDKIPTADIPTADEPTANKPYDVDWFNQLTEEELTQFKGIGPVLAKAIKAYIKQTGGIRDFEELLNVKGIGPKKLEDILSKFK